ncbi:MAG TPA: GNAT family N-acetyltransferase [Roseiflexaceae bacterium]|nr:GNAT family N-acetyltransferase [Roseiflexaceae bacterium]
MSAAPLCAEHLPAAAAVLVDAFVGDAGMRAICRGTPEGLRRRLAAWFLATMRLGFAVGQPGWVVAHEGAVVGVALLTAPRTPSPPRAWLDWTLAVGRGCGWGAVWRTAQHERLRGAHRPPQPHAVLEFVALRERYRGRGYATLLLRAAQRWSEGHAASAGIWLETTRPSNQALFEHFGYRLTGRRAFDGYDSLFLFRPNQPGGATSQPQ